MQKHFPTEAVTVVALDNKAELPDVLSALRQQSDMVITERDMLAATGGAQARPEVALALCTLQRPMPEHGEWGLSGVWGGVGWHGVW